MSDLRKLCEVKKHAERSECVDLLRAVFMFAICMIHTVGFSGSTSRWLSNICLSGVVGFVFISGWYGLSFRFAKAFRLLATGAWCAFVGVVLQCFWLKQEISVLEAFLSIFNGYWFLWAYLVLMIIAPLINRGMAVCSRAELLKMITPIILLVFGWNWLACVLPVKFGVVLPSPKGFGSHTYLTLIGIYIVARASRLLGLDARDLRRYVLIVMLVCLSVVWVDGRLGTYNSLFSVGLAGGIVVLCSRRHLSRWLSKSVRLLLPSVFPVYLYHVSPWGNDLLKETAAQLVSLGVPNGILVWMPVCALIFTLSLLLDVPRRFLVALAMQISECVKYKGIQ